MSKDAALPSDLESAQHELQHLRSVLAETAVICEEQRSQIEKLAGELELFKRYLFGRRSERFAEGAGQGHLFDEPADEDKAPAPSSEADEEEITYRRRRRGHGWGKLPEHLPREDVLIDVPESERTCRDCGEPLVRIGEDCTERVDIQPARVFVKVLVRPKYACPNKHGIQQAEAPPAPVPGGRFDFGFVAHVVTGKTADHIPLYRHQDILARSGLELSRSTLCGIMADAAQLLAPLVAFMRERLLANWLLGVDDTPVRVLDADHPDGVRTGRFWLFRGCDVAPYNVFAFHESRSRDGPAEFLKTFCGWVKVDAYGVDDGVYLGSGERIRASCCQAHARRKFDEAKSSHPALAAEALAFYRQLYDIEDRAGDLSVEARHALRQSEAVPVLAKLRAWADEQAVQALPKSRLGEALGYLRNQWEPLTSYVQDGRLPIDNNATERDLRALTIGRKNWLFIGSPEAGPRTADLYTVVASAARHHLDVWAYLRDVLERLAGRTTNLEQLLPDVWAEAHPDSIRTYRVREQEARSLATRALRQRRRALAQATAARRR